MSGNVQTEKTADVQTGYAGFRRPDEPSGNWLERILFQPVETFDVKPVQEKLAEMEEQRSNSKAG